MTNNILVGPEKWGPLAWHLLHSYSISGNKKILELNIQRYYIFYTSFIQIITCKICSTHYDEIIKYIIPLDKNKISRNYLKHWVFEIHNLINEYLNKKSFQYKKCIQYHSNIIHKDIFFFINTVYLNFEYNTMSIYEFDNIHQFFINFCYLYPDRIIKNKLTKYISTKKFKNIYSPIEFKKWYIKINIMKIINE